MKQTATKEQHLFRPLFLIAILLLLVNDLYLKYEYHNYITGKLSDFAGLFAFPYFLSYVTKKRIKLIYIFSGILFVFWKSDFSQPIFDIAHSVGIGIHRTVDYTDLISLLILPISYHYWNSNFQYSFKPKKILKPIIITITSFAFIATTLPTHYEKIALKSEFSTSIDYEYKTVRNQLNLYKEDLSKEDNYTINIPEKRAYILTRIRVDSINEKTTDIALDSILSFTVMGNAFIFSRGIKKKDVEYIRDLEKSEIEKLFLKQIKSEFKEE